MTPPPQSNVFLNDVIRLSLPMGTAIVAGPTSGGNPVNWAVVLTDTEDIALQVQLADLVLVPPALVAGLTPARRAALLGELAALSVSAVVVSGDVTDAVRKKADALELPLIVLPEGTSLRNVHQSISSLLVDQQSQISERGMQLYRRLSEMSREGQGLMAMTEVMSKLTGKIIVAQDKRLEIRALSRPIDSTIDVGQLRELLSANDSLPSVLRNRKAAAKARQASWHQVLPLENVARLISPIISGDRARGYLSVIGAAGELDLLDSLTVEQGAAACALEMAKAKAISEAKKALRGNFLEGLLAGTLPESEIERLSGRLDHDPEPPHIVMTLGWDGETPPSLRRLETTINWLLQSHNRPALVHVYGGDHICIFQALRDNDAEVSFSSVYELDRRVREQIRSEYPGQRLLSGLAGPANNLMEWPIVYRQALQAMNLGKRLQLHQLVEYNSLGIFQLLAQLDGNQSVMAFAADIVGPLAAYDRRHRSNLVETMNAYFAHHGNISQTAESLFIHRNTLLYRLERIQELTEQDLSNSDMRLAMHLALKLWQLRPLEADET
jgi:purine catabolism regulator